MIYNKAQKNLLTKMKKEKTKAPVIDVVLLKNFILGINIMNKFMNSPILTFRDQHNIIMDSILEYCEKEVILTVKAVPRLARANDDRFLKQIENAYAENIIIELIERIGKERIQNMLDEIDMFLKEKDLC